MKIHSLLDLRVPSSLTGLMQLLRRYAGIEEYRQYCSGQIAQDRLPSFLAKMEERYPALTRSFRSRCSDRQRGIARMQMIVWPMYPRGPVHSKSPLQRIYAAIHPPCPSAWLWWLLSTAGTGGLCHPGVPDFHVARDAMLVEHHITVGDYVLMYQHKRKIITVRPRNGRARTLMRGTSTWTWSIRASVMREVRAEIDACCRRGSGVAGMLAAQRQRPLFAGVRNQVIELHRYARDSVGRLNSAQTDELMSLPVVMEHHLPKMVALPVYGTAPLLVRDLIDCSTIP